MQTSVTQSTQSTIIPGLTVAIPCYNEEIAIGSVVLRALQFAEQVVVVDDGSHDASVRVATLAGARVIKHAKNGGYGAALRTIFATAKEERWQILAILDSDGQHNPDDIPAVVQPVADRRAEVAIGSRFVQEQTQENIPAYRRFGIKVLTGLNNVGAARDQKVLDGQSGFRVYSRRAIEVIDPKDSDMGISAEIVFQARKAGLTFKEIPIVVRYDVDGSSQNPVKHGAGVVASILRYAEREHPLLFFGLPGLIATVVGVLLGAYAIGGYFSSHFLPFGPTVGSAMLVLGGLLSAITGLILHAIIVAKR